MKISYVEESPSKELSSGATLSDPTGDIQASFQSGLVNYLPYGFAKGTVLCLDFVRTSLFLPAQRTGYHFDFESSFLITANAHQVTKCFEKSKSMPFRQKKLLNFYEPSLIGSRSYFEFLAGKLTRSRKKKTQSSYLSICDDAELNGEHHQSRVSQRCTSSSIRRLSQHQTPSEVPRLSIPSAKKRRSTLSSISSIRSTPTLAPSSSTTSPTDMHYSVHQESAPGTPARENKGPSSPFYDSSDDFMPS